MEAIYNLYFDTSYISRVVLISRVKWVKVVDGDY